MIFHVEDFGYGYCLVLSRRKGQRCDLVPVLNPLFQGIPVHAHHF
jgi:hypothetical protein